MSVRVLLCVLNESLELQLGLSYLGDRPEHVTVKQCVDYNGFLAALDQYLDENGNPSLVGAAFSAPGWDDGGVMRLTNVGFNIDRDALRDHLGISRINLSNDFVAKAMAIPRLFDNEKEKICGQDHKIDHVISVIGPGYGLGVSSLIPDGIGGYTALASEGGHTDLAPVTQREVDVVNILLKRYGHVSRERVLSYSGIGAVYEALCKLDDKPMMLRPTVSSIREMADNGDEQAVETIEMFTAWVAGLASDCALMFGARSGIYLSGDVIDELGDHFKTDIFKQRFTDKGRMSHYVADVPVYRTRCDELELIGLSTLFDYGQAVLLQDVG